MSAIISNTQIRPGSTAAQDQVAAIANHGAVAGYVFDPVSGTNLVVKRAFASVLTNATTSILAAVAGKKLRILAIKGMNNATASTITFKSATTAISAAFVIPVAGLLDFQPNTFGWFETVAGEAFQGTAPAGGTVALQVLYVEVPA
jgi:hypothetical protein